MDYVILVSIQSFDFLKNKIKNPIVQSDSEL